MRHVAGILLLLLIGLNVFNGSSFTALIPKKAHLLSRPIGNNQFKFNVTTSLSKTQLNAHLNAITANKHNKFDEIKRKIKDKYAAILLDFKIRPWTYLSIPISAGVIGYITNYLGVMMLFYPIEWKGIPIYRWDQQPFGLFGWQGIVPARRVVMATRIVDVTITKLLKISEIFGMLDPNKLAELLLPTINKDSFLKLFPNIALSKILTRVSREVINNIEKLVDIKDIVVTGLTNDPKILGEFFQNVAKQELRFLIDSGFGFGIILGVLQMFQMMLYPANWTLPVSGALVGYVTNWIALKWIFEPLNPVKVGPFILHGMFLKRQMQVSRDFSVYIAENILTSQKVWKQILEGSKSAEFVNILNKNIPFSSSIGSTIAAVQSLLVSEIGRNGNHPVHYYTTKTLNLKNTLINRMSRLSPAQFEQVLHPVFQEDELTLIIAGGVLGAFSGLLQWWANVYFDKQREKKAKLAANRADYVT